MGKSISGDTHWDRNSQARILLSHILLLDSREGLVPRPLCSSQNHALSLPFRPQMPFNLCNSCTRRDEGQEAVRSDGVQITHNFIRNLHTNSLSAKQPSWGGGGGRVFAGWGQSKAKVVLQPEAPSPQRLRKKGVHGQSPCVPHTWT